MKNGRLQIPEQVKDSTEYKVKLQRFLDSYVIFTKLYNNPETNNYVVKSREMVEGNNTWYLIMDYDEAKSLESYIEKEPPLYRFMCTLKKIAEAIMHVHQQGYLHMDITPGNILRFSGGGVRLMDVDSFINKEDILQGEPRKVILSYSRGYTAPEVVAYFENNLFSKNTFWKMGEKVDIFSIGAILYRYLFGKQLDFETECLLGGSLLDMDKVTGHLKQFEYERNFRGAVCSRYKDCPEKGISLLRAFMRKLLARYWKDRADSMVFRAMLR